MKTLLIILSISFSAASMADCNVTLKVKKEGAKSAKLDGVSFSAKQIAALKTICNVKTEQMNVDEMVTDFKKTLEKRIAKLNSAEKAE